MFPGSGSWDIDPAEPLDHGPLPHKSGKTTPGFDLVGSFDLPPDLVPTEATRRWCRQAPKRTVESFPYRIGGGALLGLVVVVEQE
jgi:hypothetical protein